MELSSSAPTPPRLYTQPDHAQPMVGPSPFVYANPKPWPLPQNMNTTHTVCWQHGDAAAAVTSPAVTDLSAWTGLTGVAAAQQAEVGPPPHTPGMPWSAVQSTSGGFWGAALNTSGASEASEHLTTTTLESSWAHGSTDGAAVLLLLLLMMLMLLLLCC